MKIFQHEWGLQGWKGEMWLNKEHIAVWEFILKTMIEAQKESFSRITSSDCIFENRTSNDVEKNGLDRTRCNNRRIQKENMGSYSKSVQVMLGKKANLEDITKRLNI